MKLRVILVMVGVILLNPMTESSAQTDLPEWKSRSGDVQPTVRRYRERARRKHSVPLNRDEAPLPPVDAASEAAERAQVRLISLSAAEDANRPAGGAAESPDDSGVSESVLPQPLPPVSASASAAEENHPATDHTAEHPEPTGNVTIFSDPTRRTRTSSSLSNSEETSKTSEKQGTDNHHGSSGGANDQHRRKSAPDADGSSLKQSFVIDGPIDRLGLADNLYLTGELVLALEMYEQIEASAESPEEIFWVRYQAACCLRRLGRTDEAQAGYRRIAEAPEAGWLHDLSIWWLDRINERLVLESDLRRLKQLTQDLRENHNVNSSH